MPYSLYRVILALAVALALPIATGLYSSAAIGRYERASSMLDEAAELSSKLHSALVPGSKGKGGKGPGTGYAVRRIDGILRGLSKESYAPLSQGLEKARKEWEGIKARAKDAGTIDGERLSDLTVSLSALSGEARRLRAEELGRFRKGLMITFLVSLLVMAYTVRIFKKALGLSITGGEGITARGRVRGEALDGHLGMVLRNLPVAAMELDSSGRIISFNEAASILTGYGAQEAAGKKLTDLVDGGSISPLEDALSRAYSGAPAAWAEVELVLRSGGHRIMEAGVSSTGAPGRSVCVLSDISERKRLAEELDKSRKEASETSEKLKRTIRDLEEFALLAVRRELKMREIREMVQRLKGGPNAKNGLNP